MACRVVHVDACNCLTMYSQQLQQIEYAASKATNIYNLFAQPGVIVCKYRTPLPVVHIYKNVLDVQAFSSS